MGYLTICFRQHMTVIQQKVSVYRLDKNVNIKLLWHKNQRIWRSLYVIISNICLPAHTDPSQFFLWVFCSYDLCNTQESTALAAHQNGAAQTTSVATAANKHSASEPLFVCGKCLQPWPYSCLSTSGEVKETISEVALPRDGFCYLQ